MFQVGWEVCLTFHDAPAEQNSFSFSTRIVFMRNIKSGSLRCLLWSYGGFSPLPLPFYSVMEAWMEFWTRFMCMFCFCAIFWSRALKHHYLAAFFSTKLVIHHPDLWKRFCVAPQSPKFKLLDKAKWFTFWKLYSQNSFIKNKDNCDILKNLSRKTYFFNCDWAK